MSFSSDSLSCVSLLFSLPSVTPSSTSTSCGTADALELVFIAVDPVVFGCSMRGRFFGLSTAEARG